MTKTENAHPVTTMAATSHALRAHAETAHRQATEGADQARSAIEALAALDMDKVFAQLRQMVALVSEPDAPTVRRADNVIAFPSRGTAPAQIQAQAAE